ncbi:uncharacterized protein N7459_010101 [Penicillium hispanicum]|uniref:uncharacterized protein n=1 Tax=Penicillium hispanicum TaxID=1080232 RepID=UPI0025407BD7|nr:uncharacterized protein N7459_010101 [Penicillium hispanicum]KAJ5566719.1 hypothetical protein N7459_010101 [Penicillium hispanicum]
MQNHQNVSWLHTGVGDDSRPAVLDYGRLQRVIAELPNPSEQHPSFCVFLGGKARENYLQKLFPMNNIKRRPSSAHIKLRYDIASLNGGRPILFADGSIPSGDRPLPRLGSGASLPITWNTWPRSIITALWARLIFFFTDLVCIFIDDDSAVSSATEFLSQCSELGSASTFPPSVRPKVILFLNLPGSRYTCLPVSIEKNFENATYTASFSGIETIDLGPREVSPAVQHEKAKATILRHLDVIYAVRHANHACISGKHMLALYQSVLQHTLGHISDPFDLVTVTRENRPVSPALKSHLAHYLEIGRRVGFQPEDLGPTISSALFMDNYVPEMIALDPHKVFRLYRNGVLGAYRKYARSRADLEEILVLIENSFSTFFERFQLEGKTAAQLRKEQMMSESGKLCRLRSNTICLYCLFRTAQHVLACGHTLCDRCAQVFGNPTPGVEYRFTIKGCIYCLYSRPLIVDMLPPTSSPTILAIDGGGVRGVIPLEFLGLVQEHLYPCTIQEVVDLAIGTSAGGIIVLGLFIMSWSVRKCSTTFDELACQIFRERRHSRLLMLLDHVHANTSILRQVVQWVQWLLYDSCYDSKVFDSALQAAFGSHRRVFGSSRDDPPGPLRSGPKVGVVTTSISKDAGTFVIGNFNPTAAAPFARRAREAATMLLISSFYFTLLDLPDNPVNPFRCHGIIRCRGSAQKVVQALQRLHPEGLNYASDSGVICHFGGITDICHCGLYRYPISFLVSHVDCKINLYLQTSSKRRWRISGFPSTMASVAAKQGLRSPFGIDQHGSSTIPCGSCDVIGANGLTWGKRRRRGSEDTGSSGSKRACLTAD